MKNIEKLFTREALDTPRPLAWHWGLIPEKINVGGKTIENPGKKSAIFLVHGIGKQLYTETAVQLRSGIEDALVNISNWQEKARKKGTKEDKRRLTDLPDPADLAPPFIREGYWANYPDIKKTFNEDCANFSEGELTFFEGLWRKRVFSLFRTCLWFLGKQISLITRGPRGRFGAWLLYFPLQITGLAALGISALRYPIVITEFLSDVRLYIDPKGIAERAIVQRINERVKADFMRLIGLDSDFRPLADKMKVVGKPMEFERVIWVAHSLGTVISYNVLSSLFHRMEEILSDPSSDEKQRRGVELFRTRLRRFVTLGSPIDKIVYVFSDRALRKWPEKRPRQELLHGGEDPNARNRDAEDEKSSDGKREWWFNYYHVFDPVSGALDSEWLFKDNPPINRHISWCQVPGWAHVAYWSDSKVLRFILSRAYGPVLWDKAETATPSLTLTILSIIMNVLAIALAAGIIVGFIYRSEILDFFGRIKETLPFLG